MIVARYEHDHTDYSRNIKLKITFSHFSFSFFNDIIVHYQFHYYCMYRYVLYVHVIS